MTDGRSLVWGCRRAPHPATVGADMARQLWLLRHGEAEPHGARPDAERRLTRRGRKQARDAGQALGRLGTHFAELRTSPKVRARDTARLAAETWGGTPDVDERLAEGFDARDALDLLCGVGDDGRVLVVGHEPDLSNTVAELTGARIDLKKGGLAVVRMDGEHGELMALLRPRELAQMASGVDPE